MLILMNTIMTTNGFIITLGWIIMASYPAMVQLVLIQIKLHIL